MIKPISEKRFKSTCIACAVLIAITFVISGIRDLIGVTVYKEGSAVVELYLRYIFLNGLSLASMFMFFILKNKKLSFLLTIAFSLKAIGVIFDMINSISGEGDSSWWITESILLLIGYIILILYSSGLKATSKKIFCFLPSLLLVVVYLSEIWFAYVDVNTWYVALDTGKSFVHFAYLYFNNNPMNLMEFFFFIPFVAMIVYIIGALPKEKENDLF